MNEQKVDNYTLLAVKPNSDDYCRGCHMASYPSRFNGSYYLTRDELVHNLSEIIFWNKTDMDINETGYSFTVFKNGRLLVDENGMVDGRAMNEDNYWDSDEREKDYADVQEAFAEAENAANKLVKEKQEKDKNAALEAAQKQQDERRAQELRQLAELQARYPESTFKIVK